MKADKLAASVRAYNTRAEQGLTERALRVDAVLRYNRRMLPSATPVPWKSEITQADIESGRRYEAAEIARAEREAAARRKA